MKIFFFVLIIGLLLSCDNEKKPAEELASERVELKWLEKPTFKPPKDLDVTFPRNKWVHVKVHFFLSEKADGVAELWLDGKKVIEGKGQTLPFDGVVYDRLEVGISANPKKTTTVLFVDDVTVSDSPLE